MKIGLAYWSDPRELRQFTQTTQTAVELVERQTSSEQSGNLENIPLNLNRCRSDKWSVPTLGGSIPLAHRVGGHMSCSVQSLVMARMHEVNNKDKKLQVKGCAGQKLPHAEELERSSSLPALPSCPGMPTKEEE